MKELKRLYVKMFRFFISRTIEQPNAEEPKLNQNHADQLRTCFLLDCLIINELAI